MNSKVSIIMPVLNGEKYIVEALESIDAQSYRNFELVAVNDGSTDQTGAILDEYARKFEVEHVRHASCQGIAASVNDGIRHSTGSYITFLDHDDAWFPDLLETHVRYLEGHPEAGMVHADFQTIDPQGEIIEPTVAICRDRKRPSGHVFRELFFDSFIAASTVLIRKECLDRLGGFDESLPWGDYHLWLRIARHYQIDYIPKVVSKYRQHPSQSTRSNNETPNLEPVALSAIEKILASYPEIRTELGESAICRRKASLYCDMAYWWLWRGEPRNARQCLERAIRLSPAHVSLYLLYVLSLFRPERAKALRRQWHRVRGMFLHRTDTVQQVERVGSI